MPEPDDSKFLLNFEKTDEDSRTTIMIRNIPNKYNQDHLLELIEEKFKG